MGLDNIWQVPEGATHPKMKVNICGGMFSGPAEQECSSFRGKVYSEFIQALTGISLYEDSIGGDSISHIADRLVEFREGLRSIPPGYKRLKFVNEKLGGASAGDIDWGMSGLDDLITMFSKYAEIDGAELVAWY